MPRTLELVLHNGQPALDRRPRLDTIVPTLQMGKIFQILTLPMMGPQPRIGRHIGD
jgi:hypothetical protein